MTTYTGLRTLADLRQIQFASIQDIGFDQIWAILSKELANYNQQTSEMMSTLCNPVTIQTQVFNYGSNTQFQEAGEYTIPEGQVDTGSFEVSYPLYKYIYGLGWTQDYMNMKTPADLAASYDVLNEADKKNIIRMIRKAIFCLDTNGTHTDKWTNGASLTIRGFWNADGVVPPTNSKGTTFLGTHSHYTAALAPTTALIDALFEHIMEHDTGENLVLFCDSSDVATLAGLAGTKFSALQNPLMDYRVTDTPSDVYNRTGTNAFNYQAGVWDGKYPVWVKPWMIGDYYAVLDVGQSGVNKPLAFRQSTFASMQGLKLDSLVTVNPIISQTASRFAGVSVQNRNAGAILDAGHAAYTAPTIA